MTRRSAFSKIAAGLEDAIAIAEGRLPPETYAVHVPETVDVRGIRRKLSLTQTEFARRYGFSAAAVREWEQQRRRPEAAARVLLTIIDREPEAVERALRTVSTDSSPIRA